ncbi:2,3-bisphosphoglycerate-independent phosphoglycerate mutase [Candidatus Saccharibacteria bacterium]|nr:2,3-bisphosphoglycerate-independent phosphoglycerate mutase [Candidatus Saccharibacteria bacterium]
MSEIKYKGPVVLVVLDGVGINKYEIGNAVKLAHTETLDRIMRDYPMVEIEASSEAVGLPEGQIGNSEVGHYVMGSGVISKQAIQMVDEAFSEGRIYEGETWRRAVANVKETGGVMHFIGVFSDGRVHGDMGHMMKMVARADEEGVERVRIHVLFDGRDVPARSEPKYIDELEGMLSEFNARGRDYRIASGSGRENATTNRYWSDPDMLKRGLEAHVRGTARGFRSAKEAVETFRQENAEVDDQWLPEFTVVDESGAPVGKMEDGDTVIFWNFRADRAIQFSEMMTSEEFPYFERGEVPKVFYAGMVEYDQERKIPAHTLVEPVSVDGVLAEFEVENGLRRFVASESIKFGHVTFYYNGNKKGKFSEEMEEYVDLPNKTGEPWKSPWMRSDELTDILVEKIKSGEFQSILVNYPNGDIVGHEAMVEPSIVAMGAVDIALKRVLRAVDEAGGVAIVMSDHGNIEETFYLNEDGTPVIGEDGKPLRQTRHTANPVPFVIYDNTENAGKYRLKKEKADGGEFGLSNVAATVAMLHGLEPKSEWDESLIEKIG